MSVLCGPTQAQEDAARFATTRESHARIRANMVANQDREIARLRREAIKITRVYIAAGDVDEAQQVMAACLEEQLGAAGITVRHLEAVC